MKRLAQRSLAVMACLIAFGVAATTAQAMTASLGAPDLTSRILVSVPIRVSCDAFDPSLTHFSSLVSVSVRQAAGSSIAYGTGFVEGSLLSGSLPFACDGAEHLVTVAVIAATDSAPFHGGPAVISANISAAAGMPCFPGSTTCFSILATQRTSIGPVSLHMH